MNVDNGGFAGIASCRFEQLSVRFDAVACLEVDKFRCHELCRRKIRPQALGAHRARTSAGNGNDRGTWGPLGAGSEVSDRLAIGSDSRTPFDAASSRERRRRPAVRRHLKEMPAIQIIAVWTRICVVDN